MISHEGHNILAVLEFRGEPESKFLASGICLISPVFQIPLAYNA